MRWLVILEIRNASLNWHDYATFEDQSESNKPAGNERTANLSRDQRFV
jgi:hypothetical protein